MQNWSIIIMCFDEDKTLREVTGSVIRLFAAYPARKLEIVIIDDGSTDNSVSEIKKMESEYPGIVKSVIHAKNEGIGSTLRSGYKTAINENVCAIPGDNQFDISELVPYLDVEQNQFISFYREENLTYSLSRNIFSLINKKINQFFLGIHIYDVNWVKAFKTNSIQMLDWGTKSSLIESELCAKLIAKGFQPVQIKSVYRSRQFGVSRGASLKIVLQAIKETLKLILIIRRFKIKIKKSRKVSG